MLFGPVRLITKLVSLVVIAAVVYVIVCGVQVVNASRLSTAPAAVGPASAILVVGDPVADPVARSDRVDLVSRLRQAALLCRHGRAPRILLASYPPQSGSVGSFSYDVKTLNGFGLGSCAVVELRAPNTAVALSQTARRLGDGGSVIVVTDAIDALWTHGAASGDGLAAQVSPPPSSKKFVFDEIGPLLREATGVAVGRVLGFGRVSWAAY
ncbi:MAG: hypothetical protein ABSA31_09310 [Acidimicrobiales bacterium]|jgi:hypothetical protein